MRELDELDSRADRSRGALSQSLEQYAALVAQLDSLAEHVAGLSVRHSTTSDRDEALQCNLSSLQTQLAKLSEAERAIGEATAKFDAIEHEADQLLPTLCYTREARQRLPIASKVANSAPRCSSSRRPSSDASLVCWRSKHSCAAWTRQRAT